MHSSIGPLIVFDWTIMQTSIGTLVGLDQGPVHPGSLFWLHVYDFYCLPSTPIHMLCLHE